MASSSNQIKDVKQIQDKTDELERSYLDQAAPPAFDLGLLGSGDWIRVRGLSAFWREDEFHNYAQRAVDLAVGAHALKGTFNLLVAGMKESVELYVGLADPEAARALLRSSYPGIILRTDLLSSSALAERLQLHATHSGMLSGIPARSEARNGVQRGDEESTCSLDRVVRGMRGSEWLYLVSATPGPPASVIEHQRSILDWLAYAAPLVKKTVHEAQETSIEVVDRRAQYLIDLLEHQLERLNQALAVGQWIVQIHYTASDQRSRDRLGALLAGVFTGQESRPDRIRSTVGSHQTHSKQNHFATPLSSEELSRLTQLPQEEVPGYAITDPAVFDVDLEKRPLDSRPSLQFGEVLRDGTGAGAQFSMPIDDLAKHGLVVGVTGAGKTTTIRSILYAVSRAAKPFLVIEPAKTEYRALLGEIADGKGNGPMSQLRIFTLGNDNVSPFRLNPFEFDTVDDQSASMLLSHIDFLKAVFNAAFEFWGPLPHVLEMALYQVYEDKGWEMSTGANVRLPDSAEWASRHNHPIFPTLGDLYYKVEAVTRQLGYKSETEQEIIAALQARVGSLRVGSKGLMLDVPRGNPMERLLGHSAILELENIGNDSEKTFVMGLVLARLYEYRRLQAAGGHLPREAGLQHVVVIEEAHRLLRRTGTDVGNESSNPRAQAVETFVNLLSEVRRYGQGILVAEQIPSKLAPDAIKNANLKIIHRLLAEDDRTTLAGTMNMSEAQSRHLTTLPVGKAVVFAEGEDHPLLVQMHDLLNQYKSAEPSDREIGSIAERSIHLEHYMPVPDFAAFGIEVGKFHAPPAGIYQRALQFTASDSSRSIWGRIMIGALYPQGRLRQDLESLKQAFSGSSESVFRAESTEHQAKLHLVIVLGAYQSVHQRATEYGWTYAETEALRKALTTGLLAVQDGTDQLKGGLRYFVDEHRRVTTREHGPYPGCVHCKARCQYRSDNIQMLSARMRAEIQRMLLSSGPAGKERQTYEDLATYLKAQVTERLGVPEDVLPGFAYCAGLVSVSDSDLFHQVNVGNHLARHLMAHPASNNDRQLVNYDEVRSAVLKVLGAHDAEILPILRANFDRLDEAFFDSLETLPSQLDLKHGREIAVLLGQARQEYREYRIQVTAQ